MYIREKNHIAISHEYGCDIIAKCIHHSQGGNTGRSLISGQILIGWRYFVTLTMIDDVYLGAKVDIFTVNICKRKRLISRHNLFYSRRCLLPIKRE